MHDFTEAYALGEPDGPSNADEQRVATLLDGLPGELIIEKETTAPSDVNGDQLAITVVVDRDSTRMFRAECHSLEYAHRACEGIHL